MLFEEAGTPPLQNTARTPPLRQRKPFAPSGYRPGPVEHTTTTDRNGTTSTETTTHYTPKDPLTKRVADRTGETKTALENVGGIIDAAGNLRDKAGKIIKNADGTPGPAANEAPSVSRGARGGVSAGERAVGWGPGDRPGGGREVSTGVRDTMGKHALADVDGQQREKDNQAASDARTGRDILADDGFVEYIMGWEDFANKNKDVLCLYGYGHADGIAGRAWEVFKNSASGVWRGAFGGDAGSGSLAPALYAMYHWEDEVDLGAIRALAERAGQAHDAARDGARQQEADMGSMGQAWAGEGADAARAHYGANKGASADDTINALHTANAGISLGAHTIAELLNMKKQTVEDIARELRGVVGDKTEEHYQQLVDLVRPGMFVTPGIPEIANELAQVGVDAVDGVRSITEKVASFLGALYDTMKSRAQSAAHALTFGAVPAPKAEDHPGTDLANKLKAKLDELSLPNLHQAMVELTTFVRALQTAEQKVAGLCDKVHAKGHEILQKLPPDPGQAPAPPGQNGGAGSGAGGGGAGGGTPPDGSPIGSELSNAGSGGTGSGGGSALGSAGQALGSAGQALGSAGQALGSARQALGQAASGLGSALGGVLSGLLGSIGQIIQTAAQAAQQAQQQQHAQEQRTEHEEDPEEEDQGPDDKDKNGEKNTDHEGDDTENNSEQPKPGQPGASPSQAPNSPHHPAAPTAAAPAGMGRAPAPTHDDNAHEQTQNNHGDFEVQATVHQIGPAAGNQGHITGFE